MPGRARGGEKPAGVIEARRRAREILELRYRGVHWGAISRQYGVSEVRIRQIYQRELGRITEPVVHQERKKALEAIDLAVSHLWSIERQAQPHTEPSERPNQPPRQIPGDQNVRIRALLGVLKWEEFRARLLGTEMAPVGGTYNAQPPGMLKLISEETIERTLFGPYDPQKLSEQVDAATIISRKVGAGPDADQGIREEPADRDNLGGSGGFSKDGGPRSR